MQNRNWILIPIRASSRSVTDDGESENTARRTPTGRSDISRSVCPGQHLADNSVYIAVAMTLAVFAIAKAVDENGAVVEPEVKSTTGTLR